MFNQKNKIIHTLVSLLIVFTFGCAHKIAPAQLPENANPEVELQTLKTDRSRSLDQQADVLAPINFTKSNKYYEDAVKETQSGRDRKTILESIAYSKAYLVKADEDTVKAKSHINEIVTARKSALDAGAAKIPDKMLVVDRKLQDLSADIEKNKTITPNQISKLQQDYLNLELAAIKADKLGPAKNDLNVAKEKGADRAVEKSYALAVQKYNAAEKDIETDRSNKAQIDKSSAEATLAAQNVLKLYEKVELVKKQSPEQNAMSLQSREDNLQKANDSVSEAENDIKQKDSLLIQQQSALVKNQKENRALMSQVDFDQALTDAQKEFSKEEADVYQQGKTLIIRLKSMEFASGSADLPQKSLPVLNKVSEVIQSIGSETVTIEGHTDGVGNASNNKALSEKRAESVAKFLVSDNVVTGDQVKSVGFGFDKPLATNKTKEGRAQNRRVDIVITPSATIE